MNLHGGNPEEIIKVMNAVAVEGYSEWHATKPGIHLNNNSESHWTTQAILSGVNLRLKQRFTGSKLNQISLLGNGWMLSFRVNRVRPNSLDDDKQSFTANLNIAPIRVNSYVVPINERLCLHSESVLSPEEFKKEMSLIRMFVSEWN